MFIEENLRDRGFLADATNDFLGTQLLEARSRLEQQEAKLKEFRERYSGRLPSQEASNMQAITTTQMQLQALVESTARDRDRRQMLERLLADARSEAESMRSAALMPAAGTSAVGENALAGATATQQLEAARAALAQMELRLKPEHPDIKRMKRVISDLEKKAEQEALQQPVSENAAVAAPRPLTKEEADKRTRVRDMMAEIESLDRQIQFKEAEDRRLRATIAGYQARIEAVPGLESEWISLSRDYDTLQANYKQLLSKSEDSKVAANLERRQIGEQFRVLDPARVPERPVSPKRIQINGMGAALGLLIGLGLIGLMEYRDSSFRTDVDVVNLLSLPVLAVVPQIVTRAEQRRAKRRRLMLSMAGTLVFVVVGGGLFWYLKLWNYLT
jgi:polysaccharide chain length determinant protein (PEP-CTERM system associated)